MGTSVKDLINKATEYANTPRKSGKPVFLFFKKGQKALIRPMFSLDDAITMQSHNKYSDNPDYRVNAICASELGKACEHCANAKELEDKQLKPSNVVYLPVYVHQVVDVATGQKITYKEKDESDREVEKPVSGFRVLELPLYGKPLAILQTLMSHERDEDLITTCDFSIEQQGEGQKKNFIVTPKAPKSVNPKIQEACPGIDKFHEAILAARPPLVAGESVEIVSATPTIEESNDDDIPVF